MTKVTWPIAALGAALILGCSAMVSALVLRSSPPAFRYETLSTTRSTGNGYSRTWQTLWRIDDEGKATFVVHSDPYSDISKPPVYSARTAQTTTTPEQFWGDINEWMAKTPQQ